VTGEAAGAVAGAGEAEALPPSWTVAADAARAVRTLRREVLVMVDIIGSGSGAPGTGPSTSDRQE
jgi:hypothetical protein